MFRRLQNLSQSRSFFLFGARGTGKTTLIQSLFAERSALWIDLLDADHEERYIRDPEELARQIETERYDCVVIDEVQKAPKLLDVVHRSTGRFPRLQFAMTGSSARKLKRGAANLLAGRAFTYQLYPLTRKELGSQFSLDDALFFGTLPRLYELSGAEEKSEFLRAYARTYLREEIIVEQLVRKIDPFRVFLEVAGQTSGSIVNFSKVARDVGVEDKTVRVYFDILRDTLIGFYLPAFHRSVRKQQRQSPKFYFFDPGVRRALEGLLNVPVRSGTYEYGRSFEQFIICECARLNEYLRLDYKMSYLRTKDDAEIDLIVQRPAQPDLLIEIKSYDRLDPIDARKLQRLAADWPGKASAQIWSRDPNRKIVDGVSCIPWEEGLAEAGFLGPIEGPP